MNTKLTNDNTINVVANNHYTMEGRYILTVTKPDGTSNIVADFPNLITNGGLDRVATSTDYLSYIHVGTGNTTPNFADTALATFRASSATATTGDDVTVNASTSPYYTQYTIVKRFDAGVATGNLTEVGVGWSATTGSLFSRALILDGGGSPTTITLLSDEVLDVTYIMRVYAPLVDVNSTIAGYTTVLRAAQVTAMSTNNTNTGWGIRNTYFGATYYLIQNVYSTQTLGAITSTPSGTVYNSTSPHPTPSTYVNGTYTRTTTITYGLNDGNAVGGIGSLKYKYGFGTYQVNFTPVIPKDNTKVLTFTIQASWGRV